MTGRSRAGAARWALGLGLALALWTGAVEAGPLFAVGLDGVALGKGERIVGFEVTVTSGRIAALPSVPVGWAVSVDNYPTWRTRAEGAILIGVAALDPADFRDFLVVEAYAPPAGSGFAVDVVLVVTADFEHERRLRLPAAQVRLSPRPPG